MYEPVAIKPLLRSKILHDFVYNSYFKKKNFFFYGNEHLRNKHKNNSHLAP